MIVLDTNVVIAILNKSSASIRSEVDRRTARKERLALSSISVFELYFGVEKSRKRTINLESLRELLDGPLITIAFDDEDAAIAGDIRATLEVAGSPIGPYDLLIAAQAVRHDATLVTANVREFSRVPGLKVEDWGAD